MMSEGKKSDSSRSFKYITIKQNNIDFYLTSMPADFLYNHGEVRRQIDDTDRGIQRILQTHRAIEIANYIKEKTSKPKITNTPLFVTPIVVSINSDHILEDSDSGEINVYAGEDEKDVFSIIDGQHRLAGIQIYDNANNGNSESLSIPVTFVKDADLYTSAEIFLDINANQKPVDWSSMYNLFGIMSRESGEKTVPAFANKVVALLNNREDSPFYKGIKIYGVKTDEHQFISQATVGHKIAKNTWRTAKGYPRAFTDMYDQDDYEILSAAIINIFTAFKIVFPDIWESNTLAKKAIGYSGIMNFLIYFVEEGQRDLKESNFESIFMYLKNNHSDEIQHIFSSGQGSSESVANAIGKTLIYLYGMKNV
ncbi:DGQHR domain-containing protein [Weissella paramesenteroides]|uniref:DGQHR domain-containing protein n=1 Tax=Weissella paramesenteroides TaxID=1249 RepID=UPI003F2073DE